MPQHSSSIGMLADITQRPAADAVGSDIPFAACFRIKHLGAVLHINIEILVQDGQETSGHDHQVQLDDGSVRQRYSARVKARGMPRRFHLPLPQRIQQLGSAIAGAGAGSGWRFPNAEVAGVVFDRPRLPLQPDAGALRQALAQHHPGVTRQAVRIARAQVDAAADGEPGEAARRDRPHRHRNVSAAGSVAHHQGPLPARLVGMAKIARVQDFAVEALHAGDIGQLRIVEDAGGRDDSAVSFDAFAGFDLPQSVLAGGDAIDLDAALNRQLLIGHPIDQVTVVLLGRWVDAPMQGEFASRQFAEEARCIQAQRRIKAVPGHRQRLRTVNDAKLEPGPAQRIGCIDAGRPGTNDQHIGCWHQLPPAFGSAVAVSRM